MDVLQGTLDLMVLRALNTEPMHGYNILDWLRRATSEQLRIEDAALYPALHRLEARGYIRARASRAPALDGRFGRIIAPKRPASPRTAIFVVDSGGLSPSTVPGHARGAVNGRFASA